MFEKHYILYSHEERTTRIGKPRWVPGHGAKRGFKKKKYNRKKRGHRGRLPQRSRAAQEAQPQEQDLPWRRARRIERRARMTAPATRRTRRISSHMLLFIPFSSFAGFACKIAAPVRSKGKGCAL